MISPSFLVLEPDLEPRNLPPARSFRICSALPSAVRRLLLFVGVICSDFGTRELLLQIAAGFSSPPTAPVLAGKF
ncbi:hypothetical protein SLEP1_g14370 [Rubroshorea leprosula]|uniref:Uncharacterized protein n=1 Tax=Rubroshorea leprosula TaxID=152421 RepID=A0AAV5IUE4_9ROSI|nr:hypothetical protein SLEP1_g14370 [Rubroshorea leprosula]